MARSRGASAVCAGMLVRSYRRSRQTLLLWSGICFSLLAANNLLVVLDMVVLPGNDFSMGRQVTALLAVGRSSTASSGRSTMNLAGVISGAIILGYAVAGLFFLKFWRRTGDAPFLAFADHHHRHRRQDDQPARSRRLIAGAERVA